MQPSLIMIGIGFIVLVFVYFVFFYPWQLHWGATRAEVQRPMPGDEIVGRPSLDATRAVTIHASAQNIYPWIVQMGITRGGWHRNGWLENLGEESQESILPEHQDLQAGDLIPVRQDGKPGMWVKYLRKNKWVLWWDRSGDTSWVWEIQPEGNGNARLIARVRTKYKWFSPAVPFNPLTEFFHILMMRKSMLGIKRRAERPL
ncbi:MAG TPA: hypothetical protein VK249_30855 [Anaerolineales bacterium]|nr:hypothetical protein [Anaerolineales bacterium]